MEDKAQLKLDLYRAYLEAWAATKLEGRFMPYGWACLPNPVNVRWLAFSTMLEEFSRELANTINALTNNTKRLKAWAAVVEPLSNEEKAEVSHEFISTLAAHTVMMTYVIKSRFAFSVAHLCHQANFTRDPEVWKDDLPLNGKIYLNTTDKFGMAWRRYKGFKRSVEKIHGKEFREATCDFRHAYNHRFSPRFVIGIINLVTREINAETSTVRYAIGERGPLDLGEIANLLIAEQEKCYRAFEKFQQLVYELVSAIEDFERTVSKHITG